METKNLSHAQWRTSSYSGGNGACVEVVANSGTAVFVRDTKDRQGSVLAFRPDAWRRFAQQVKVRPLST